MVLWFMIVAFIAGLDGAGAGSSKDYVPVAPMMDVITLPTAGS